MARYAAEGAVLEVERACLVATGVPNAFYNPVFLYRPPDDIDNFLRRTRAFYDARGGLPWTLLLSRWVEDAPTLSQGRLNDAGLVSAGTVPLLVRETQRAESWSRFHPNLLIESVTDRDMLSEYRETLAEAFGVPGYVTEMLLPEMPPPTLRLYLAYKDGHAVGTAALFDAVGVGGIYNLGVHPACRRDGIATALIRHALDEACWELSLTECVAQSSRAALPVFLKAGFERVGLCHRYVEPQHMPPGEGQKRG